MKIEAISQVNSSDVETVNVPWLILHCLGFGTCLAWVHVSFFSSVVFGDEGVGLASWLVNLVANGLTMIVVGLLAQRTGPLAPMRAFGPLAVACVTGGTVVSAFMGGTLPDAAWFALGPALTGIGTAGLLLLWAEAYQDICPFRAKKYTLPGAMTAGVIVYLLVTALNGLTAVVATACLPVLSLVCLRSTYDARQDPAEVIELRPPVTPVTTRVAPLVQPTSQKKTVLKFMLVISAYCLASGFMSGRSTWSVAGGPSTTGITMFGGIALLMIAIAVLSIAFVKPNREDFAYRMIVPLMAAGLLLMPFIGESAPAASQIAIMGGYIILEIFAWSTLQDIARRATEPAATIFGVGKAGMNIGLIVGCALGIYASAQSTMIVVGISVCIVYVFILLGALTPKGGQTGLVPPLAPATPAEVPPAAGDAKPARPQPVAPSAAAALDEARRTACRDLAERYGLSQREEDVLRLLSYGRNLDAIADALGIAQSTVRSHRDHIYRKLGVHTRQELLDIVDGRA